MLKLTPTPALDDGVFDIPGITISQNSTFALASLAVRFGQDKASLAASKKIFGAALPSPQDVLISGEIVVFWTGPDQYFVQAPIATHEDIEANLKAHFGEAASITDQSGGWTQFDLTGPKTIALFERLTMVDLAQTPKDRAVRTVIEHIGCFLLTREDHISVLAPRSYAGSLFHALTLAAKSV